jgi:hypothetical protein
LKAQLRRQRLRTWLERRALAVLLDLEGTPTAHVELVAKVRGRAIGRASLDVAEGQALSTRVSLSSSGTARLRDAATARVVLAAVAIDQNGRRTKAISRVRVR